MPGEAMYVRRDSIDVQVGLTSEVLRLELGLFMFMRSNFEEAMGMLLEWHRVICNAELVHLSQ
jgi:hypothetical protein